MTDPTGDPPEQGLCLVDESNDMEAFAALPECTACGGTGKDVPDDFWTEAAPPIAVAVDVAVDGAPS